MRPPIYNWEPIREEFINDNVPLHNGITLKTIAEKYDIPYQTVRRRAAKEKWHSGRYQTNRYKTKEHGRNFMTQLDKAIEKIEAKSTAQN